MKKILSLVVATFFLATCAFGLNETQEGPQHITNAYMEGVGPLTSGSVVILETSSPTKDGQVTGCATTGVPIYGVVVDTTDYDEDDLDDGGYVRVQLYGYTPIIRIAGSESATVAAQGLYCSGTKWMAANAGTTEVSGNAIAFDATVGLENNQIIDGFLYW